MCRSFSFSVFDDRYFQNAEECNGHLFFLLLKIGCFKENKEYAGHLVFLVLMTRSFKKGKGMCWSFSFIVFIFGFYWHCILTNMVFNVFLPISNKISQSLIFAYENSHAKPRFINTALNEFLIKFYHGFNKHSYIFELQSLFETLESLKSVEFPMHAVVRNSNSKHFYSNASSFKIIWNSKLHCSYISCVLWKIASLKRKRRLSLSERYKAITE